MGTPYFSGPWALLPRSEPRKVTVELPQVPQSPNRCSVVNVDLVGLLFLGTFAYNNPFHMGFIEWWTIVKSKNMFRTNWPVVQATSMLDQYSQVMVVCSWSTKGKIASLFLTRTRLRWRRMDTPLHVVFRTFWSTRVTQENHQKAKETSLKQTNKNHQKKHTNMSMFCMFNNKFFPKRCFFPLLLGFPEANEGHKYEHLHGFQAAFEAEGEPTSWGEVFKLETSVDEGK